METWQADSLAAALCQSFPRSSITADVWATELAGMDQARAEEAVRRIRRTFEHAPTIAAMHATYNGLANTAPETEVCTTCHGTGMVTDTDHPRHWPGRPGTIPNPIGPVDYVDANGDTKVRWAPTGDCACNVATWCRQCDQGQRAQIVLRSMNKPAAA